MTSCLGCSALKYERSAMKRLVENHSSLSLFLSSRGRAVDCQVERRLAVGNRKKGKEIQGL